MVFVPQIVASARDTFSWTGAADVTFVRGQLAAVASYAVDVVQSLPGTTFFTDGALPAGGYYYLVKHDCPAGSWQTALDAQPDRDAALP